MYTMHLLPSVAIQPNLKLKTRPKLLLGSLLLVIALPGYTQAMFIKLTLGHAAYGWQTWPAEKGFGNLTTCMGPVWKDELNSLAAEPPAGQLNPVNDKVYEVPCLRAF
jgi:hypothetical protein